MSHVVMHVWRVPRAAIAGAVARMAVDRVNLVATDGLRFHKLLGTGNGRTFEVGDADPRTWALLTVWESHAASLHFEAHATPRGWRRLAEEEWRADMICLRSSGLWSGQPAFVPDRELAASWTGRVAAITRARIRPTRWRQFWRAVPDVVADLAAAEGPSVRMGIGEAPIGVQGTFTVWPDSASLADFAYRRPAHRAVIDQTADVGWYAEDLFARLAVISERGTLFGVDRSPRALDAGPAVATTEPTTGTVDSEGLLDA